MDRQTIRARIYGTVQGVCFREYTRRKAEELGLSGWVKNCADGSVEALISGPPEIVAQMISWLHRGSPRARVERVVSEAEDVLVPSSSFRITF